VVMAKMVYAGDLKEAEPVLAAFRALAKPIADFLQAMPYADMFPEEPYGPLERATRIMFARRLDARAAATILEYLGRSSALVAACEIRALGGAMARVPADATAFAHRQSRTMLNVAAIYDPSTSRRAEQAEWVAGLSAALDDGDHGAYAGFLGDEGEQRVRAAYPGATWDRLTAVKASYDPENLFRLNQNIPPMSAGQAAPGG